MVNKIELKEELEHIHNNFDFSEDCTVELKNVILGSSLAYFDEDDILFLSSSGEELIGYNDNYDTAEPEEDYTQVFLNEDGVDNDY
jgi:hypothetical protein